MQHISARRYDHVALWHPFRGLQDHWLLACLELREWKASLVDNCWCGTPVGVALDDEPLYQIAGPELAAIGQSRLGHPSCVTRCWPCASCF
jgi:hypothetical protein